MSDDNYEPSPKIPRRATLPSKVPNLQMKEDRPWNTRRRRILGRKRTRRYRERKKKEASQSQSILAQNDSDTSDEESYDASQEVAECGGRGNCRRCGSSWSHCSDILYCST